MAARSAAVVWNSAVGRLGLQPENGVQVIATGRISAYGERSSYQLIIERLEYAGIGAMLARIERLRLSLAAEGLFDAARKRMLPLLPQTVGVITSEAGAVLHDIRITIARRFPRPILLWPVPVQGEGAAARIAAAIAGFSALPLRGGAPLRPEVLIVARGGGSLEDLMAFNEELVVRAAAASSIPLISAVGHETDTTLIDHVSDRRAPTPTAAAELAVPSRIELIADLHQRSARLLGGMSRSLQERRLWLGRVERELPDLPSLAEAGRQRLDDRAGRLLLALPHLVAARRANLIRAERNVPDLVSLLAARRGAVQYAASHLRTGLPHLVAVRRTALVQAERHIPGPRNVLVAPRAAVAFRGRSTAVRLAPIGGASAKPV